MCKKQPLQIKEAKSLRALFAKIKIKCIHNNCKRKPDYFDYINHIENCEYRLYHCTNNGCTCEGFLDEIKYHSNEECKFRIVNCHYCSKQIKARDCEVHEKNECTQIIECPLCHLTMTRAFYNTKHYNKNGENIVCLKGQVDLYKKQCLYYKSESLKFKKEIETLKEKNNKKENENEKLEKKLEDWKNSFTQIYNKFFINDYNNKIKEDLKLKTLENEDKCSNNTFNSRNYGFNPGLYTPKKNNFNYFK